METGPGRFLFLVNLYAFPLVAAKKRANLGAGCEACHIITLLSFLSTDHVLGIELISLFAHPRASINHWTIDTRC